MVSTEETPHFVLISSAFGVSGVLLMSDELRFMQKFEIFRKSSCLAFNGKERIKIIRNFVSLFCSKFGNLQSNSSAVLLDHMT